MDLKKQRLPIAIGALVLLTAGTVWALQRRDAPTEADSVGLPTLPEIEEDAITALEIERAGEEMIRLERGAGGWRMTAPVDAETDQSAISTALSKLASLELVGVAATREANYERLSVDDESAVRVVAKAGEERLVELRLGAFRAGHTMVRLADDDRVFRARGSLKYAFDKPPANFRDRRIVDEQPSQVREVAFAHGEHRFRFVHEAGGEWQPAPAEGEDEAPEIERFNPSKVHGFVTSLARLRAADFADASVDTAAAGLDEPSATVTLTLVEPPAAEDAEETPATAPGPDEGAPEGEEAAEGASAEEASEQEQEAPPAPAETRTVILHLGDVVPGEGQRYLAREGGELVYRVSSHSADRLMPTAEDFQSPEPGSEPEPPPMPGPGAGAMGPGAHQKLPPEIQAQIQQAIQQQQMQQAQGR